jgi:hypothetical protein
MRTVRSLRQIAIAAINIAKASGLQDYQADWANQIAHSRLGSAISPRWPYAIKEVEELYEVFDSFCSPIEFWKSGV